MNMFKKNGGFTLVELIVVIAILAILAAVAIPAYSGYIKNANDSAVKSELTAFSTSINAANAVVGPVATMSVNADGTVMTVTGATAEKFASDFTAFSGKTATAGANAGEYTIALEASNAWNGSSYNGKGATWSATEGWDVTE